MSTQGDAQKADLAKQAALAQSQWESDVKWLMGNDGGKRILRHFIVEGRKRPFTGDERVTSYNLGRQEFIRDFLDSLRAADFGLFQETERFANGKKP